MNTETIPQTAAVVAAFLWSIADLLRKVAADQMMWDVRGNITCSKKQYLH